MIFGKQPVKIKANGSFLTLDYSVAKYSWDKTVVNIEHKDYATGFITNDFKTSYSEFEVTVNIFKYESYPERVNKWYELYSLQHATVDEFYPHADGYAIKDSDGRTIKYFVESVIAGQAIQGMNDYDIVTIKFVPLAGSESGYSVVATGSTPTVDVTSSLNYWTFEDNTTQGWTYNNTMTVFNGSNISGVTTSVIAGTKSLYVDVPPTTTNYGWLYQSTPIAFTSGQHYKLECFSKKLSSDESWSGICFFINKQPITTFDDLQYCMAGAELHLIDTGNFYSDVYGFYNFTPTESANGYVTFAFINNGTSNVQYVIDNIRLSVITVVGARYGDGGASTVAIVDGQLLI